MRQRQRQRRSNGSDTEQHDRGGDSVDADRTSSSSHRLEVESLPVPPPPSGKPREKREKISTPRESENLGEELKVLIRKEFGRVRELYNHGYLEVLKRIMKTPQSKMADALRTGEDDVRTLQLFVTLNAQAMQNIVKNLERRLGLDRLQITDTSKTSMSLSPRGTPLKFNEDPILRELRHEIASAVHKMTLRTSATHDPAYKLYWQRWWVLTIFSLLSLFNNVVCFTFAPITTVSKEYYGTDVSLGHLVAFFFLAYIIFSFPSSRFVEKYGLRAGILLGAWLQVVGNSIRCLGHRVISDAEFPCVLVGQLVASLAQPFFVNPPPLIAASWFGKSERTMATTIAVNSNQFGIAVVYFLAPTMVHTPMDIPDYLDVLTLTSLVLALAATLYFPPGPPTPPSRSKDVGGSEKLDDDSNWGLLMWQRCVGLFFADGFTRTVLVFGTAEATINSYSTFLNSLLVPRGFTKRFVSFMGILFIVTCMLSSGPLAYFVDLTRKYKTALLLCLFFLIFSIAWINFAESYTSVTLAIAMTGMCVGPIQPVVMELAAQITYPSPEELMATVQQVAGNCISILMFLIIDAIHDPQYSMIGILVCVVVTLAVFLPFEGKLGRDEADNEEKDSSEKIRLESWKEQYLKKHLNGQLRRSGDYKEHPPPLYGGLGECAIGLNENYGSLLGVDDAVEMVDRGQN